MKCNFENKCLNEGRKCSQCSRNNYCNDYYEERIKKVCNTDCEETLTKGKEYEILSIEGCHCYDGDVYIVKDDKGFRCRTLDKFFN